MRVLYGEGLASHAGPESCAVARKGESEALTGESAGLVLSREITRLGCRRRPSVRKATPTSSLLREDVGPHAVRDPVHARKPFTREPGGPTFAHGMMAVGRNGKSKDVIQR